MSETITHECSVAGLYWMDRPVAPEGTVSKAVEKDGGNITPFLQQMLADMQNRGQLAAGITTYNSTRQQMLDTYKDVGTVNEVFRTTNPSKFAAILKEYAGCAGIGHTRYGTCGQDDPRYAQPFERHHGRLWKWFSFAFNGTLSNYPQLRNKLLSKSQYHITLDSDTEIIMHTIARALRGEEIPDLKTVMQQLASEFDGAYNIVFLDGMGRMFAARDPLGIRPLCWAVQGQLFAVASESLALRNLGFRDIHHFLPGEMILVDKDGYKVERYMDSGRSAHCFFEWIYFANAASEIDSCSVYLSRERAGQVLASLEDQPLDENCIVVPVPDTAKAAASAFAFNLKIPNMEGLLRNRYAGRTFIQSNVSRGYAVRSKYWVLPSVLKGKKIFLMDDSIVRSTTMRALVCMLRDVGGVSEIHVRVACPPVIAPCFYGVDMSSVRELFAPPFIKDGYNGNPDPQMLKEMAAVIGVDSLRYLPMESVAPCIGCPEEQLCLGCINGKYPTPCGNELYKKAIGLSNSQDGRIYD